MTHIDLNERQRIVQARKLIDTGQDAKARKLLSGIDHPKAQALREQLEPAPANTRFPLLALFLFVMIFTGAMIAGFFLLRPQSEITPLPTLYPTAEPTEICDNSLWQSQHNALVDGFLGTASAASRTMPSDRLDDRITELQTIYAQFDAPCDTALLADYQTQQATFNDLLTLLEQWANGELDGTQFSMAFDTVWQHNN